MVFLSGSRFLPCIYIYMYMHVCRYIHILHIHIHVYSSYDETIQRKQSAQYRKRRAITVKVTLTSARCDTVFHNVQK